MTSLPPGRPEETAGEAATLDTASARDETARRAARAAALLLAARRSVTCCGPLPPELVPKDLSEGYAAQAALVAGLGRTPTGYKIGATSSEAQHLLGLAEPFAGRTFKETTFASPAQLKCADFFFCLIEPEFALRMGQPVPPRAEPYGLEELAAAVASVHPAIEVVTSAYGWESWTGVGASALVADDGVHGALVLGPGLEDWRGLDLAAQGVRFLVDGALKGEGAGANALGGPLKALAWLVEHLTRRDLGLLPGEVVTTGVVTPFLRLEEGQSARAEFGPLGAVEVTFE